MVDERSAGHGGTQDMLSFRRDHTGKLSMGLSIVLIRPLSLFQSLSLSFDDPLCHTGCNRNRLLISSIDVGRV